MKCLYKLCKNVYNHYFWKTLEKITVSIHEKKDTHLEPNSPDHEDYLHMKLEPDRNKECALLVLESE